ncbi:4Fe-4S ferredoxin [Romeria aff. gracilis LEGE 07310]|uniref:4Fe-4S ferredoxin n=1 Tax=Vasconcelosia minhoensis LEGE 07310 TaxID=915328 RepID=A0A8J7DLT2_9CYAN|nr:LdpA C-terminal domain-containing domain [Romeria gracilis]MBE9077631.1 4Fe-4S ferredoxin [Romeria aff. gracilis LEGE 07310]
MRNLPNPLQSLQSGHWFKLICGASYQHLPAVRNLALAYSLAGADCIDVAADAAVVAEARAGVQAAIQIAAEKGSALARPWLMVSLNDGEDPHFRKAVFDPARCPADCARPCEAICPAGAIVFNPKSGFANGGVTAERCYGCGRCLPVCPIGQIETRSQTVPLATLAPTLLPQVDAVEIHTQVGRVVEFTQLWNQLRPWVRQLQLVSVSCPDGAGVTDYLRQLYAQIQPRPAILIWQADGRPMSGDIGKGTTHAAIRLGQKLLTAGLPGYVQLAGGTNRHTVEKLQDLGLLGPAQTTPDRPPHIAGIAYGSFARSLLMPHLETFTTLETMPDLLWPTVRLARSLVQPLKLVARPAAQVGR